VCRLGESNKDYYEVALAHQTIGKIYYHRQIWNLGYDELCIAVRLLENSLPLTNDVDYTKMLKLVRVALPDDDKGKLSHRNYLGGIVKLGLKREKIGDKICI
jgi:hypothetical protein